MADYKIKVGEISAAAMNGVIDRNEAGKRIGALPDPMTAFNAARAKSETEPPKTGGTIPGTPSAADGAAVLDKAAVPPVPGAYANDDDFKRLWPHMTPEERELFMGQ